jgi:hypothetical protein
MNTKKADKYWWASWVHDESFGEFTLPGPWWCSGVRYLSDGTASPIIVAAIVAPTELSAKAKIYRAYERCPFRIAWQFCDLFDEDAPFSDRFPNVYWSKSLRFWEVWDEI